MRYARSTPLLLAALALSAAAHSQAQGDLSFTRRDFPAGKPVSVTSSDFNSDGRLDVVVSGHGILGGSPVAIMLGRGDGTFQAAQDIGLEPSDFVTVGDFNGDGRVDVIYAVHSAVFVLLGNGDGTFEHRGGGSVFPPGPVWITVGDFNGDGRQDAATAGGGGSASVAVLLGTGDGGFEQPRTLLLNGVPSLTAGDFNGDSQDDLAIVDRAASSVSIYLSQGDGTFEPPRDFGVGFLPGAITIGDFDGDGEPDLATANGFAATIFPDVSILLGQGDGTFEFAGNFAVGDSPASITVGDFNGDGQQDLATTANSFGGVLGAGGVSVLLGQGDGTFEPAQGFVVDRGPRSLTAGDFTGDGQQDIVTANLSGIVDRGGVSLLINLGAAEITTYRLTRIDTGNAPFQFPDLRDINENGEMVGSLVSETEPSRAILLRDGMASELGDLAGGAARSAVAVAINDFTQITGSNKVQDEAGNIVDRGFLWEGGQIRDLGLPGAVPNDINNGGQIVGTTLGTDNLIRPFLWHPRETRLLETLDRLACPPGPVLRVDVVDINSHGVAVGYSKSPDGFRAVFWRPAASEITALEPAVAMTNGGASAVNDQGDVIGSYSNDSLAHPRCMLCAGGVVRSFLWQLGGDVIELPPLERAGPDAAAVVTSINYQRQIVGDTRTRVLSQPNGTIATLWQNGAVRELNDLISDDDPLKGEVNLFSAIEINEAGVILARGLEAGLGFTYVLTPTGTPASSAATPPLSAPPSTPATPSSADEDSGGGAVDWVLLLLLFIFVGSAARTRRSMEGAAPAPSASSSQSSERGGGAVDRVSLLLLVIGFAATAACARRRRLAAIIARSFD